MRRRDRGLPFDAERVAMWTMAAAVVVFALHSAIDWTWFVPGNVVPALLLAGWVAGRGPLRDRLRRRGAAGRRARRAGRSRARAGAASPRRRSAGVLAALAIATALLASWAAYQPQRSVSRGRQGARAARPAAKYEQAVATAQTAVDRNPLSAEPLFELAAIQQARGQTPEAKAALIRATEVQPASAEAWRRLGQFRLDALSEPRAALKDFQVAYYLDPTEPRARGRT